ncbi:hypothetical protein [Pseudomonas sp. CC6-YY-74]|uniref:hypothetical protein n=1 Tax=Pseudomonas sp. CC6-YY-74 TaxID=1930532 RepID=UPI0012AC20D3|nr:hypothetical protein [Pseudomonas sp. CC6-YY-74]
MSIVSYEHNFVFIKTKKVAGTSVEAHLRGFAGECDIVPAVTPRDEHYCASRGHMSKNYLKFAANEQIYTDLVLAGKYDEAASFLSGQKKSAFSHMDYSYCKNLVEASGFDVGGFYSFSIDRHPYSWLLSSVLYDNAQYNSVGGVFWEFDVGKINYAIAKFMDQPGFYKKINWNKYTEGGRVVVDRVIDFDDLSKGLSEVLQVLGLPSDLAGFPDLKKSSRHLDAFHILDFANKARAQTLFSEAFSFMNYDV